MAVDGYEDRLRAELNPVVLLQHARTHTGLSDFGDDAFLGSFTKLMDCVAADVVFHDEGLDAFTSNVIRALVNRLRVQDALHRHPEILDEDVSDPIIITGLPRSGTTKMQRMISAAPRVQKTLLWRLLNPAPFPDSKPGEPDPRIAAAGMGGAVSSEGNADFTAAHLTMAGEPEEDWILFEPTFNDWIWSLVQAPTMSFDTWSKSRPDTGNYRYVRTLLQYLQWQDGGKRGRPWILKAPVHMSRLEAVLDTFPNATLLMTHRDPRSAIPSMAKLQLVVWSTRVADPDLHFIGDITLKWWSWAMDRCLAARDDPRLDERIVDVPYAEVRTGPLAYAKEAFRRAGYPADEEAERCMRQWEAGNEQGIHGQHVYSLEEFGLTGEQVDKAFATYIDRFVER